VTGTRPSSVYLSPDISTAYDSETNKSYSVWTTDDLTNIGVGFILRWRPVPGYLNGDIGAWRYPTATWTTDVPPSSDGFAFYRGGIIWHRSPYVNGYDGCKDQTISRGSYPSLAVFRASISSRCNDGHLYALYAADVEVRYVLTKPLTLIGEQLVAVTSSNITTDFVILKHRESSNYADFQLIMRQTVTFRIPPIGTCITPSAEEGAVYFGTVYSDSFPNGQWGIGATRDFTLTFRNCPRVNVKYYVHANGNRWVDSANGRVGVQDSVPGAPNPVAGNPRGFAVRLQHRSSGGQHTGNVYIHPNEVPNPLSLPDTQAYTRNWQGAGTVDTSTGVTHTIPMRATLVRTGSSSQQQITPGAFTTSVIVAISYP